MELIIDQIKLFNCLRVFNLLEYDIDQLESLDNNSINLVLNYKFCALLKDLSA